ncbi:isoamylase early set domain-containing protein [Paraglaciecola sp.]|uniref:isoamylase early set domain-containing protein n=1 Tax=Paraglaciecola sp. TaxID=1920173 RepID=UPI003EF3EB96
MAFKKQYLKSKSVCKVTFKLTKEEAQQASKVSLVGEFNDWDQTSLPMKKLKNGGFTTTVDLPKDSTYQFRYLLDNELWENDWQADSYAPSPVSLEENSVVTV